MKLTVFGQAVRQFRIEKLIRLKDMAEKLGVSSAFLSAVETGNKEIPFTLADDIVNKFNLTTDEASVLYKAADETKSSVTINMPNSLDDRYLVGAFARNLEVLDADKKQKILKLLRGDDES